MEVVHVYKHCVLRSLGVGTIVYTTQKHIFQNCTRSYFVLVLFGRWPGRDADAAVRTARE